MKVGRYERRQVQNAHTCKKNAAPREEKKNHQAGLISLRNWHSFPLYAATERFSPLAGRHNFLRATRTRPASWSHNRARRAGGAGQMRCRRKSGGASKSSTRKSAALSTRAANRSPNNCPEAAFFQ